MRKGYNPYLITPYKKKNWLYIIQFYINERGARQDPLTRPSSPRIKKNNSRRRECMQKVAFTFIFYLKFLLTL